MAAIILHEVFNCLHAGLSRCASYHTTKWKPMFKFAPLVRLKNMPGEKMEAGVNILFDSTFILRLRIICHFQLEIWNTSNLQGQKIQHLHWFPRNSMDLFPVFIGQRHRDLVKNWQTPTPPQHLWFSASFPVALWHVLHSWNSPGPFCCEENPFKKHTNLGISMGISSHPWVQRPTKIISCFKPWIEDSGYPQFHLHFPMLCFKFEKKSSWSWSLVDRDFKLNTYYGFVPLLGFQVPIKYKMEISSNHNLSYVFW